LRLLPRIPGRANEKSGDAGLRQSGPERVQALRRRMFRAVHANSARSFVSPLRGSYPLNANSRLTPWTAFCRCSAVHGCRFQRLILGQNQGTTSNLSLAGGLVTLASLT